MPFRIYAPPPPQGYAYRYSTGNPDTLPEVVTWSALYRPPEPTATTIVGYTFKSISEIPDVFALPQGSRPVYAEDGATLLGYDLPITVTTGLGPQWYGAIPNMVFVRFAGPTSSNGFPTGPGPDYTGSFDVPNVSGGVTTVTRTYRKTGPGGALVPIGFANDPAYCTTTNAIRVCVLANFPGAPFVPATIDTNVYTNDPGFNAYADSMDTFDDNFRITYTPNPASGPICLGYADLSADFSQLTSLERGLRHETNGERVYIIRDGVAVAGPFTTFLGDEFVIERKDYVTSYYVNGNLIYIDPTPSSDFKVVLTFIFASGDYIE